MRKTICAAFLPTMLLASGALAQPAITGPLDPMAFSQLKDFTAHRSSSNSSLPDWNDDSKHPLPGETLTIADLTGPGIVTHIWTTASGTEYGWPRLLRLRVYYDGSDIPSVDSPLGDFFAVGHGFERPIRSLVIRNLSDGRARNSYWPMPIHAVEPLGGVGGGKSDPGHRGGRAEVRPVGRSIAPPPGTVDSHPSGTSRLRTTG